MKFISKNSNLRIVLKPGIPANQMSGIAGQPGVYVKFQNGMVDISDEEMIKKMNAHPGFNQDFIAVDDNGEDPFASRREENEPVHIIQDIRYGHVEGKRVSPHAKTKLDPQIKKLVDELAMEQVNKLLPKMVEETVKKMIEMGAAKSKAKEEASVTSEEVIPETKEVGVKPVGKKKK